MYRSHLKSRSAYKNVAKKASLFTVVPKVGNYEGHFYARLKILKSLEVTSFVDLIDVNFYQIIVLISSKFELDCQNELLSELLFSTGRRSRCSTLNIHLRYRGYGSKRKTFCVYQGGGVAGRENF